MPIELSQIRFQIFVLPSRFRNQLPDIVDAISERFCFKSGTTSLFLPENFSNRSKNLSRLSNHSKPRESTVSNSKMQRILRKTSKYAKNVKSLNLNYHSVNSLRPMKIDTIDCVLQVRPELQQAP